MELSHILAKFFGFYLVIIGIFFLVRKEFIKKVFADFCSSPALITFGGAFSLLFGLWIVLIHPIFQWNWQGVITILGVICILKGIIRLFAPKKLDVMSKKLSQGKAITYSGVIVVLVGLYLLYHGFIRG